mmetsp:Transcript_41311/g.110121  ORF Transcript_41311/g.110121 Transcript_41311/m.110121 type:complete len:84 (+) Transcript_41311:414-665(+)
MFLKVSGVTMSLSRQLWPMHWLSILHGSGIPQQGAGGKLFSFQCLRSAATSCVAVCSKSAEHLMSTVSFRFCSSFECVYGGEY